MAKRTKIVTTVPAWIEEAMQREHASFAEGNWREKYWDSPVEVAATREAFERFAILLKMPDGELFAVDFCGFGTDSKNWNVLNDSSDSYGSIYAFLNDDELF